MHKNLVNVAKISAIAISLTLAGCASTSEIEKIRATADEAKAAAAQAQQTADAAKSTADQALKSAEEGKTCCNDLNEKIDRMFKKSMNK